MILLLFLKFEKKKGPPKKKFPLFLMALEELWVLLNDA